jgi:hypothetical protein
MEQAFGDHGHDEIALAATLSDLVGKEKKTSSYSRYRVELTNRSIADEVKRDAIRAHLVWLASKLDDYELDHQLITLKYELMARADPKLAAEVKARAQAVQANRTDVVDEI